MIRLYTHIQANQGGRLVNTQCKFDFLESKDVEMRFNEGPITSDGGLAVFIEWMNNESFLETYGEILEQSDERCRHRIDHTRPQQLRQRMLQIVAGYEDANDSDELREDPLFRAANGNVDNHEANASQPTIHRLENAVSARTVVQLNHQLLEDYIEDHDEAPDQITIEIDGTPASAHGNQQRALFDGYRGQTQYHPLMVADSETGELLSVRLREGTAHDKHRAYPEVKRILSELSERFPDTQLRFRADDGFTDPRMYRLLDEYNVAWTINFKANPVLKRRTDDVLEEVCETYEETGTKTTKYVFIARYQAGSWERSRPVVAKVECGPNGANQRFVVCSVRPESPKDAFDFYESRGVCEQYIREFKDGFRGEKLSCHRFVANAFRLVMVAMAYTGIARFRRRHLTGTELEGSWIERIRRTLFKIGARIEITARRLWIRASRDWPYQSLFKRVARSVCAQPG